MNKEDAWAWITTCADKDGRRITQFEVMEGPERGNKLFKGNIMLKVRTHPQMPPQQVPFEFDFPEGKSLNWCKKNFDEESNKAVQEWEEAQKKAQMEARKAIVTPDGKPAPLLGADGKPMGG